MPARNLLFTMTEAETGKVLWFKFEPTSVDGVASAVDISQWAITITITTNSGTPVISAADCVPDADQVANIGEGTFTFDVDQAALMTNGWYKGQILGIDENANEYIFPTTPNTSYFRVKVNERL